VLAHSTSTPEAPGQLKSHYAPQKRFYLGEIELLLKEHPSRRVGTLTFRKKFINGIDDDTLLTLSSTGDMHEAARNLFSMLRRFDKMDIEVVLAEEVPNEGFGRAINDRLRRAAAEG
jgi:L-threonylcarbamoyladenylate synthase